MKILVVDDSVVFRSQITAALSGVPEIEVVGAAPNGRIALQKLAQLEVDLMTLDLEMPEMGGIETLQQLRALGLKTKVIVFSTLTQKGAQMAMQALELGAVDVVGKPEGSHTNFESVQELIRASLLPSIRQFLKSPPKIPVDLTPKPAPVPKQSQGPKKSVANFIPEAVVIASSTGGPAALEAIFNGLTGPYRRPLLITQHMPPVFTEILAKRLSALTGVEFAEAKDGEPIVAGRAYIAPGDFHLRVRKEHNLPVVSLGRDPQRNSVRPAADYLFETAAEHWGSRLLGVVLTGMGEDGAAGCRVIRNHSGRILIQSKETCVVFGMPGAVFHNDDYDEIQDLETIRTLLKGALL